MKQELRTLSFNLVSGIGHLELNQLPANKMNAQFFSDLKELVDSLKGLKGLEAIVISSTGRHFSSGADLEELLELSMNSGMEHTDKKGLKDRNIFETNYNSFLFFEGAEIPVIAAIRGVCIGSAFEFALSCHFRFCGEDAVFGLPETTFNLMPGLGGIRKTAALCGKAKAIELVLKGNTFGASEALLNHLVDRIVPRRNVVDFSFTFARKIMKNYKKQKAPLYLQQISSDDLIFN
ncbi:MAG: enoyl-CoA hydratase/isomerase family protein [Bacteroidetes bacterium]|nr:enoyl-CoA hydratase/isomerase family protein [Bacteroidota bacterium]